MAARNEGPGLSILGLFASLGVNAYQAWDLSQQTQLAGDFAALNEQLLASNAELNAQIGALLQRDTRWQEMFAQVDAARRAFAISARNEREHREQLQAHLTTRDQAYAALQAARNQAAQQVDQLNAELAAERARVTDLTAGLASERARAAGLQTEVDHLKGPGGTEAK